MMSLENGCKTVELYGGAMASQIPTRFLDVASFRQVPDQQEVFVDVASEGSLMVELFEWQNGTDLEVMQLLWDNMQEDNDAIGPPKHVGVVDPTKVAPDFGAPIAAVCEASGSISAHKFNKTSIKSHVDIQMILFRLQKFKTELLITFNLPCTEVPSLEPVSKGTKEPEPEMPIYSTENGIAASGAVGQIRTVNDILTSFYREHAPESERKTAEQITTILQKRDDGGPFWFSKLRAALQAKYKVELQPLGLGTEARSIANVFVRQMRLKDPGLFG